MGRAQCRGTPPPAGPGPPTQGAAPTPPTVQRGGGARTTSSRGGGGSKERGGRPTAPQPARPPPRYRRGPAPGDQGGTAGNPPPPPPPSPPPGLRTAGGRPGRQRPRTPPRGRGTQGGGAAATAITAARQVPPVGRPLTPTVPAADRQLCAGAQGRPVGRSGTATPRNAAWRAGHRQSDPPLVPARRRWGDRPQQTDPAAPRPAGPPGRAPGGTAHWQPPLPRQADPPTASQSAPGARGCPAAPAELIYQGRVRWRSRGTGPGARANPPGQGGGEPRRDPPSPLPPTPPSGLQTTGVPALQPPQGRGDPPAPKGPRCPGGGGGAA